MYIFDVLSLKHFTVETIGVQYVDPDPQYVTKYDLLKYNWSRWHISVGRCYTIRTSLGRSYWVHDITGGLDGLSYLRLSEYVNTDPDRAPPTMNLEDSRIYKSLIQEPFHKVAKKILRWTEEGRDVNFKDDKHRTYLHVVAENVEKFRDQRAVPVVYQLCVSGIDVDAKNIDGDTCLHLVVKHEGTYRIIIALLR